MIIAIVSVDEKYGIGKDGKLLVSHSEDMNFFKTMTTGNIVVMGRKTWDSLPKKPLPNRTNIIITSHPEKSDNIETTFTTMEDFLDNLEYINTGEKDIYIIGGASIYKQLLPYCERIYMTLIPEENNNADTFFPVIDMNNEWKITMEEYSELSKCYFLTIDRKI